MNSFRYFVMIIITAAELQITVDILILDILICKLKNTWLSGMNVLVHRTGCAGLQSPFLRLSALWLKDQVQASPLDILR